LAIEDTVKRQGIKKPSNLPSSNKGFDVERFKKTFQEEIQKGLQEAKKRKY